MNEEERYRRVFDEAASHLRSIADRLQDVLHPADAWGLLAACAYDLMRQHTSPADAARWLREMADEVETGQISGHLN